MPKSVGFLILAAFAILIIVGCGRGLVSGNTLVPPSSAQSAPPSVSSPGSTASGGSGTTTSPNPPASGSTSTPPATAPVETLYQTGNPEGTAVGFNIDPKDGHLTPVPGEFPIGQSTFTPFAPDPTHRIFVADNGPSHCERADNPCTNDTVVSSVLRDTSSGVLTLEMDNVVLTPQFSGFAFIPSGKFAYAVDSSFSGAQRQIRTFSIDYDSGQISEVAGLGISYGPSSSLFSNPSINVLYGLETLCCAQSGLYAIHSYAVNGDDGSVSEMPGSPVILSGGFWEYATVSQDGKYLYATRPGFIGPGDKVNPQGLAVFSIDQRGMPSGQALATLNLSQGGDELVLHPNGDLVYMSAFHGEIPGLVTTDLHVYKFDPVSGSFTDKDLSASLPSYAVSIITFDSSGRFLYVRGSSVDPILLYDVNQTDGTLTLVGPQPSM